MHCSVATFDTFAYFIGFTGTFFVVFFYYEGIFLVFDYKYIFRVLDYESVCLVFDFEYVFRVLDYECVFLDFDYECVFLVFDYEYVFLVFLLRVRFWFLVVHTGWFCRIHGGQYFVWLGQVIAHLCHWKLLTLFCLRNKQLMGSSYKTNWQLGNKTMTITGFVILMPWIQALTGLFPSAAVYEDD